MNTNETVPTESDPMLLLPEVGARLRCSVKTVRRLITAGALKSFKVGGRRRVRASAVSTYLERQETEELCHV